MSNIAHDAGKYTNFTGTIHYYSVHCEVKNATFELLKSQKRYKNKIDINMVFYQGNITGGEVWNTDIKHCFLDNAMFYFSIFRDGVFNGSKFLESYWLGGKWVDGDWKLGYDKFGRTRLYSPTLWDKTDKAKDIITEPGRYRNFTGHVMYEDSNFYIANGNFEIGEKLRYRIVIDGGVITNGTLCQAVIDDVVFKGEEVKESIWNGGTFNGNEGYSLNWHGGIWKGGKWCRGTWWGGVWEGGDWSYGTWHGGYDKNGNFHHEADNPSWWNI